MPQPRVAIVGAGPSGLDAALAARGISDRELEQAFEQMHRQAQSGHAPAAFAVTPGPAGLRQ